jgi:tetratricopeptide (TPR) repeat protein
MQPDNQPDNLTALEDRVAAHPARFEDLTALADAYGDRRRWQDAIRLYTQAISLAPTNADAHNNLGTVYEEVGQLTEAEQAYRQAIALKPNNAMAYSNLGALYEEQQRLPEAVQAFEKCLQYSTDSGERATAAHKLAQLFPERADVVKMYQGIRGMAATSLLLGGLSVFAGGTFDPVWGIVMIVIAILAWQIKIPAMFVVYGVILGWAAVMNGVSAVIGSGLWWLPLAFLQIYWLVALVKRYRKYRRLRLPELFQAGAWPAQLAPPQSEAVISDRFATVGAILAVIALILVPTICAGSVALTILAPSSRWPQLTASFLSGIVDVAVLALALGCAALLSNNSKQGLARGAVVASAVVLVGWLGFLLIANLLK